MGEYLFIKFDVVLMYESLLYLIIFIKCLQGWFNTSFEGRAKHHRVVNQILGNLLRLH
jgi:hypothetical protein